VPKSFLLLLLALAKFLILLTLAEPFANLWLPVPTARFLPLAESSPRSLPELAVPKMMPFILRRLAIWITKESLLGKITDFFCETFIPFFSIS
jgi:hypothetical protein